MLPTVLVTLFSFMLDLCSTSPVYNMQPAYITANIGTTGRNIRNLPCISRKNNQSGVCMFAIDCLKANGTHLGTCIDRFYFGSCCHIEPIKDHIGNDIDESLIPAREPPMRLSTSTTVRTKPQLASSTTTTERFRPEIISDTRKPITYKISTTTTRRTTTKRPTTSSQQSTAKTSGTTQKPPPKGTMVTRPIVTEKRTTTVKPAPIDNDRITTFQSIEQYNTRPPSGATHEWKTTERTNPTKKPIKSPAPTNRPSTNATTTTKKYETARPLTTTQSGIVGVTTKTTGTPRPQPTTTQSGNNASVKPRPTIRPITRPTSRPRPSITTGGTTVSKPVKTTTPTSKRPTATTAKPAIQQRPTAITGRPSSSSSSSPSSTKPPLLVQPTAITTEKNLDNSTTITTTARYNATTETNELPVNLANATDPFSSGSVNGNTATNEIESARPPPVVKPTTTEGSSTFAGFVTWSVVEEGASKPSPQAQKPTAAPQFNVTPTTEDWVPITTPDGWILLPSLPSTSAEMTNATSTTTTTASTANDFTTSSTERTFTTTAPAITSTSDKPLLDGDRNATAPTVEGLTTTTAPPIGNLDMLSTMANVTFSTADSASSATTTATIFIAERPAVNMSDYTDVCGRRMYPEARIVGGEKSTFGKWPWQISLRQWRTSTYLHKCGAALLNENWAITAAHCVDNVPPSDLLLRLGEHDLSTESEPYLHQERRVQIVASHPQFDPRTFEYDLALLRFYEPVKFQPNIVPVCVPQSDETFVGRTAYVTGWGRLYEDGPLPSVLQEVSVPVINNTVCETMYRAAGYIEHIPHIFICAGWRRGGFDSCEGDSGGPMVIQRPDKRFLLAGVISWGIGCAEPNQPGVYTRISEFREWVNQILQF